MPGNSFDTIVAGAGHNALSAAGYLATYFDLDKTCAEIARFSAKDAEAYRACTQRNGKLLKLIIRGMFTPPIGIGTLLKLVGDSPGGRDLTRLMF